MPTSALSPLLRDHRCVAVSEFDFESAKIGGAATDRVPEGWLLIHHGVAGELPSGSTPTVPSSAVYSVGALLLDPNDPSQVLDRTDKPLMKPHTAERGGSGTVPTSVFPTAIAEIDGRQFVFYGMADARIGVAELERTAA